jgi:hypothetical protein
VSGLFRMLLLTLCGVLGVRAAHAEVVRHAVVIGNDLGSPDEEPLRFAEADARKVFAVLRELGGFQPENMVLLERQTAAEVQRVLISVNARIRTDAGAGRDTVLFVYYSGHADAEGLHPGATPLELSLLERLVQGSPAAFRILVLDACRSGALTRVKGGRAVRPFAVQLPVPLASEGVAFLTSSSAHEDAQESDALQGSFFTHYLVSGLRGPADQNRDGAISLEEVYAYAYQHTLSASSETLYGTQHPTFRLDLKGHGAVPLTWTGRASQSARLALPEGHGFLLFAGSERGPVVAEVGRDDVSRTLALDPGRYFVRGRARDYLLEGEVQIEPGVQSQLDASQLRRVEYARLARKGGTERIHAHGPWLGYQLRTPLWSGAQVCQGARGGYAVDLSELTLSLGAAFCRSVFESALVHTRADEASLGVSVLRVFDLPFVSVGFGATLGAGWLRQSFDTRGLARTRNGWLAFPGAVAVASTELGTGFSAFTEAIGRLSVFRQRRGVGSEDTTAVPGLELTIGASKRF